MSDPTLTNKFNLPQQIVKAIVNDKYDRGESDFTVTQLLQPPQIGFLQKHWEPVEDVSDRIWALLGSATHSVLERAYEGDANVIVERRFYMTVNGKKIGGQVDVYDAVTQTLYDYKVTSVWSAMGKPDWEKQLNLLKLLLNNAGIPVKKLVIIPIFRDWQKSKAKYDKKYPQSQCVPIDIPVWPEQDAFKFLEERLADHMQEPPRPCTDEERWATEDVYAVMKQGKVAAVRLYKKPEEALQHMARAGDGHTVVHRPKEFRRCMEYCAMSPHCPQWNDNTPF